MVDTQPNFLIHIIAAAVAIALGFYTDLSRPEWMIIVIAIGLVFITETVNTAIEVLADKISQEYDKKIGIIKDVSAASVLFSALAALALGLLIFVPKFI